MATGIRRGLLVCGILSSILYAGMDAVAGLRYPGYSFLSQTISELSAVGAPTRALLLPLGALYSALAAAFGVGVLGSAGKSRALRVVGGLLVAYGSTGVAWPFAPMQMRGNEFAWTDAMHIVLSIVSILLMLSIMGFGATALGPRFRRYSIGSIFVYLVFGVLTGLDGPRIAANLPTPWVGLYERICFVVFLLWVAILAVALLRRPRRQEDRRPSEL